MSKHTAGPWEICHGGHGSPHGFVIDEYYVLNRAVADDVAIAAEIVDPETGKPSGANARLIAAAPDLLIELRQAVIQMEMAAECIQKGRYDEALLHASSLMSSKRAAIAKATGE